MNTQSEQHWKATLQRTLRFGFGGVHERGAELTEYCYE